MQHKPLLILTALLCLCLPTASRGEDTLPPTVQKYVGTEATEIGSGTYRHFGFKVYVATLWAKNKYDPNKPYALQLRYTRSVSKETMVDIVTGDIRDQNVADDATLARWEAVLNQTLPPVEDGDTLIGLSQPGKKSLLFYNGKQIASIDDAALSQAFFNIWLGQTADEDMRTALLGQDSGIK